MKPKSLYAQVAFPLPLDKCFDYRIPSAFVEKVAVGSRVRAPFGKGRKTGYLVGLSKKSRLPARLLKSIEELIDEAPLLDEKLLELARRISAHYLSSLGEVLEAIFPASLRPRKRGSFGSEESESVPETPSPLGDEEREMLAKLSETFDFQKPKQFLLFGGPDSNKTELILQAVGACLERGRSSIVLYPEISLLREAAERFKRRFGNEVCQLHSQLSPLDRYQIWKAIKEGRRRVVLGVRSAIFSPAERLGLIILTDEQDRGYKQEESPRYHARRVALLRSELEGATLLLESETPSLESYAAALEARYTLLALSADFSPRPSPKVSVIDMREELFHQKRRPLFSKYLERRMDTVLKEKGQTLLFLNRRGFSTFIHCRRCGTILRCKVCQLPLKYHSEPKRLICHLCNREELPPEICSVCRGSYLQYKGVGTEKVESEVHRTFPEARIGRLDSDSVKRSRPEDLVEAFRRGDLEILIGTQMVAREILPKGIPLVGILSADTLLNTPDFRSSERAFTLLNRLVHQAKGEGGEVVIQSFFPQHPAILTSSSQDYPAFYKEEVRSRKELGFPPFRFLAKITFRGKKSDTVAALSHAFKKAVRRLKKGKSVSLVGPAPSVSRRIKGESEWQLLVKSDKENLAELLKKPLSRFKTKAVKIIVDIDPY